jgi:hypothetical protein
MASIVRLVRVAGVFSLWLFSTDPFHGTAHAQSGTGTLEITVRSAFDERILAGAQVSVEGMGLAAVSNQFGVAYVVGIAEGARRIRVRYLGHGEANHFLVFGAGRTTRVMARLEPQPIPLAEVRVRAWRSVLVSSGFFERRDLGHGTFLTREEIQRSHPRLLSDVVRRVPGIDVASILTPRSTSRIRGGSPTCRIQYFINGVMVQRYELDYMLPDDVEGMEIYKGAAAVPAEFNRGSASCGVILIWTRLD